MTENKPTPNIRIERIVNTKQEIPQICSESGVSQDYFNEFAFSVLLQQIGIRSEDEIKQAITQMVISSPIKHYCERYPDEKYNNPVNESNSDRIRQLDELADYVNSNLTSPDKFTLEDVGKVKETAKSLIWSI